MRKLRIALVSAGGLIHIDPYAQFFSSRGHDVCWIAYGEPTKDIGVPTYIISRGASGKKTSSKWRYFLGGHTLRRLVRQLRPDVLNGHYVTSAGTICLMSGFRPYVLTAHGSDLFRSSRSLLWRPLVRRILAGAAAVNTVSYELRDVAIGLGVPSERVLVSTLGVDTVKYSYNPPRKVRPPVKLLCTRTLGEVYDPLTILRACELLRTRGLKFTLTFAAGGPLMTTCQEWVASHGLADQMRFLGGYRNEELPELLRQHDAYVSAALWDGTSISLLEAMSSGLVPIVSRTKSNLAWLKDGISGFMFDCGNPEELATVIERAVADQSLRESAAEANRATALSRADRHRNMCLLEARLLEVAGVNGTSH